jgi:hypothetical protein
VHNRQRALALRLDTNHRPIRSQAGPLTNEPRILQLWHECERAPANRLGFARAHRAIKVVELERAANNRAVATRQYVRVGERSVAGGWVGEGWVKGGEGDAPVNNKLRDQRTVATRERSEAVPLRVTPVRTP